MIGTIIGKNEEFDSEKYRECVGWCNTTQLGILADKGNFFEVIPNPYYKDPKTLQIEGEINMLKDKLRDLDYIGVKIATGRATKEEYEDQIKLMIEYADRINLLEAELDGNN